MFVVEIPSRGNAISWKSLEKRKMTGLRGQGWCTGAIERIYTSHILHTSPLLYIKHPLKANNILPRPLFVPSLIVTWPRIRIGWSSTTCVFSIKPALVTQYWSFQELLVQVVVEEAP